MADTSALYSRITTLWGIDNDSINIKLSKLRIFLCGVPDYVLLDLLLKSDLEIERSVNLHFSGDSNRTPTPNPPNPSPNPQPQPPSHSPSLILPPPTPSPIINEGFFIMGTPSPSPVLVPNNNNNNNNNKNNEMKYLFEDDSDYDNQLVNINNNNSNNTNNVNNGSMSPLLMDLDLPSSPPNENNNFQFSDTDSDDFQILNPLVNNINIKNRNNNNRNNRKRKLDEISNNISDNNNEFPRNKRRKIYRSNCISSNDTNENENNNSNNSTNSNSNSNNSNSNSNNNSNSMDIDDNNSNSNNNNNNNIALRVRDPPYNDNWTVKVFGILNIEYNIVRPIIFMGLYQNGIQNINDFCQASMAKTIEINKINNLNHQQLQIMKDQIVVQLFSMTKKNENGMNARFLRSRTISKSDSNSDSNSENDYKSMYDKVFEQLRQEQFSWLPPGPVDPSVVPIIDELIDKEKLKRDIQLKNNNNNENNNKSYIIEFRITLNRKKIVPKRSGIISAAFNLALYGSSKLNSKPKPSPKPMTMFDMDKNYILCALYNNNNNNIINHVQNHNDIVNDYENKGHSYSLVSLLDYSCRYNYKNDGNRPHFNHKLNIKLHPYQNQSLNWMIGEENSDLGFHRHFYVRLPFNDGSIFYYSNIFNKLIIHKQFMPKSNGGFLCEEMGLGKTIISLALINCNKMNTINSLIETHSEIRNKNRYIPPPVDNEGKPIGFSKMEAYTETYRWYKSSATLIIGPVSLIGQWEKECDDKSNKQIKHKRYYGSNRKRNVKAYLNYDIIFTTPGIVATENGDDRTKHILHQIEWYRIIIDESHTIKNAHTQQARNMVTLRARNKWCLTGTPFGKWLSDIENQLKFIGFNASHLSELQFKHITKSQIFNGGSNRSTFQNHQIKPLLSVIKNVIMRHTKAQQFNNKVIVKMGEKDEGIIWVDFTPKQREYYNKLYNTAKERYEYYKSINNVKRGSISILASLHPARQACSGMIYNKEDIEESLATATARTFRIRQMVRSNCNLNLSSTELFAMATETEEAFDDKDGECPICLDSPYENPVQTPCRHVFCSECIKGLFVAGGKSKQECPLCRNEFGFNELKRIYNKDEKEKEEQENKQENKKEENDKEEADEDDSKIRFDSKIKKLISELKRIKNEGKNEKSLVFTSFSKSLDWMCKELKKHGFGYRTLTGSMSMSKRKKSLEEFEKDPNVSVFVLTVRSGAVGITLTSANHVFMMEPCFNAALYRQAINRVYRLGQKKKVYIKTLIMRDSIEEKIWNVNKDKDDLNVGQNVDNKKNKNLAGNIQSDKNARLEQSEIAKLFEDSNNNNSNNSE